MARSRPGPRAGVGRASSSGRIDARQRNCVERAREDQRRRQSVPQARAERAGVDQAARALARPLGRRRGRVAVRAAATTSRSRPSIDSSMRQSSTSRELAATTRTALRCCSACSCSSASMRARSVSRDGRAVDGRRPDARCHGSTIPPRISGSNPASRTIGRRRRAPDGPSERRLSGRRQLGDVEEEVVDLAHDIGEVVEVDRLGDEDVGVQVVAARDVLVGARGRQHDDRDRAQRRVRLDLGEHLVPALAAAG